MDVKNGVEAGADDGRTLENNDLSVEDTRHLAELLEIAENRAAGDLLLLDAFELDLDILAANGRVGLLLLAVDIGYLDLDLVGHDAQLVAQPQHARLELAHDHGAHVLVLVDERHAHGSVCGAIEGGQRLEALDEARSAVPGADGLVDGLLDEGAREARARHEEGVLVGREAALAQVGRELLLDLVVARLVPVDRRVVHLVDEHDQVAHARRLHQHGVLARLTAALEARLELAATRRYDEHGDVGLRRAANHVGHEAAMAGRVQYDEVLLVGLEEGAAHLDRLALLALLDVRVESPRQVPRLAVLLLRLALVLLQRALVHHAREEHDLAADGRLAGVHVAAEDHVYRLLARL